MAPAAPSVVALPPQATSTTWAPASTAAAMSSPVPRVEAATASRSLGRHQRQPAGPRHLDHGGAAALEQRVARLDLAPERVVHARRGGLAAQRREQHLHGAVAAVGDRAQVGRRAARRDSRPRPIAAATSVARKVPLNESGATSTGRSVMLLVSHGCREGVHDDRGQWPGAARLEPQQGLLSRRPDSPSSTSSTTTWRPPRRTVRGLYDRPTVLKRWTRRDHRRGLLPEARAREAPRVAADRDGALPVGSQRHRARAQRRRPPDLGRQPRQHRLEPVAGAPQRPRPSRRAAHRPRSAARRRVDRGPRGRAVRRRRPARARDAGLPEDERLARHPRQRPHRAALELHRGAPRRARARARGRAPDARARDDGVVEGGAHRRVPRLQPERARPHRRLAVLGARGARREGVAARCAGTRWPTSSPRTCAWTPCPRACARSATSSATIDDVHHSLDALLDLARRDEEEGLGDAPWPPHFAKQAGEPKRVQPSRARGED